jgi:hypothetical protein
MTYRDRIPIAPVQDPIPMPGPSGVGPSSPITLIALGLTISLIVLGIGVVRKIKNLNVPVHSVTEELRHEVE